MSLGMRSNASAGRVVLGQGVEPPSRKIKKFKEDGPAIARMACPIWWRRKLRAHHARTLETAAIRMGQPIANPFDMFFKKEPA